METQQIVFSSFSTKYRSAPSWAMRTSALRFKKTCPIVSSYHDVQPDHHSDTNTLRRWFVVCRPFWSVYGLHGLLGFALLSSCRSLGLTFRTDGNHSIFRPVFHGGNVVRCPPVGRLGRGNSRRVTGLLFWVMVVLL